MAKRFEGKVAVVTGARGGICEATVRHMIADGATVVGADLVTPEIECALGESFDLTDEGSVANCVERVVSRHGRIDIVHNNAALQSEAQRQRDLDVINLDTETWDAAMAVNARGPMLLCKHAIPHMIAAGGGSIIHRDRKSTRLNSSH